MMVIESVLYHWTNKENLNAILKEGIKVNGMGIIYLTKFYDKWKFLHNRGILFKVKVPNKIRLSTFEEYKDGTEILCWGNIPKENIKVIKRD